MVDLVGEVLKELSIRGRDILNNEHCYGLAHPLIGKPCLYEDSINHKSRFALPYGASAEQVSADEMGTPLLAIAYYAPDSIFEGRKVHVKALSAVKPAELIPVDPN